MCLVNHKGLQTISINIAFQQFSPLSVPLCKENQLIRTSAHTILYLMSTFSPETSAEDNPLEEKNATCIGINILLLSVYRKNLNYPNTFVPA